MTKYPSGRIKDSKDSSNLLKSWKVKGSNVSTEERRQVLEQKRSSDSSSTLRYSQMRQEITLKVINLVKG